MCLKPFQLYLLIILVSTLSCQKFVEIDTSKTELVSSSVFTNDATARSAIDGLYSEISSDNSFSADITLYGGLSSDEMSNYSTSNDQIQIFQNSIIPTNGVIKSLWGSAYNYIYNANAIIENLTNNNNISDALNRELTGEAKFLRAFLYFYLTNLYGNVPLVLSTDYRINKTMSRTDQDKVYDQIVKDLTDAKGLLPVNYSFSNNERTRPNKYAAIALLARVYLYRRDWINAEQEASEVINSSLYNCANSLDSVFIKNSEEAIWQLAPVIPNKNTNEGIILHFTSTPTVAALSTSLLSSFESGDARRTHWIDSSIVLGKTYYCPFKYKVYSFNQPVTEYYTILRLAEQYLIRAEARAEQNNLSGTNGAVADVNIIRKRAGLPNINVISQSAILGQIRQERKIEFFAEWGHRWFDLKRSDLANNVLGSKPNWNSTDVWYPIPQSEITNDPNLTQNQGYSDGTL